jgi:hypothetical protein
MPIIQISQIKHRRGLRNDLPKSLEEGEIGLTLDTGEVFIGTPNFPPAIERKNKNEFPFGNTQILTEWSDNVKNLLRYKYLDRNIEFKELSAEFVPVSSRAIPSLEYNTGISAKNITIVRKLQEKLDEYVSVKDYGASGDGIFESLMLSANYDWSKTPTNAKMNAETAALRRAILDVYNTNTDKSRKYGFHPKKLHFPAGIYHINDSLPIPPYSHWIGEGKGNTFIALTSSITNLPQFNCLAFTVDGRLKSVDSNNIPEYVSKSYQNMDPEFAPEYIIFEDISFVVNLQNARYYDVIRFIGAKNIILKNCRFIGNWSVPYIGDIGTEAKSTTNGNFYHYNTDTICLVFDSFGFFDENLKPRNILISNCEIGNTTYGCLLTDDINDIFFEENIFNRLYRGISLNEIIPVPPGSTFGSVTKGFRGPQNVVSIKNIFRNIKREGEANFATKTSFSANSVNAQLHNSSFIISNFNRFENVGYNNTNKGKEYYDPEISSFPSFPISPAINFSNSIKNVSIGDSFERGFEEEKLATTIEIGNPTNSRIFATNRRENLIINQYEVDGIQREIILLSSKNIFTDTGIEFRYSNGNVAFMNYSINVSAGGNSIQRVGTAKIIINETQVIFDEEYSEVGGNTGIELSAIGSNPSKIRYRNPNANNAKMRFEIKWYKN